MRLLPELLNFTLGAFSISHAIPCFLPRYQDLSETIDKMGDPDLIQIQFSHEKSLNR